MNWARILLFFALLLVAAPPSALAQAAPENDRFASALFTPEEIMLHGRTINLTDEQRHAITRLLQDLQGRAVGLQWRLLDETESMKELLSQPRIDLDRAMDRFKQVLDTEMEIKRVHLELLIRIKNVLTREQQEGLERLRSHEQGEPEKALLLSVPSRP
jgi:Spy/CpxP family protein refolding chaperone